MNAQAQKLEELLARIQRNRVIMEKEFSQPVKLRPVETTSETEADFSSVSIDSQDISSIIPLKSDTEDIKDGNEISQDVLPVAPPVADIISNDTTEELESIEDLIEPAEPEDLIEPAEPEDLIEPAEPEDLIESAEPEDLIEPAEPEDLIESAEPEEADFPVQTSMEDIEENIARSHQSTTKLHTPDPEPIPIEIEPEPILLHNSSNESPALEQEILSTAASESAAATTNNKPMVFDQQPDLSGSVVTTQTQIQIKSYTVSAVLDRAFNLGK